MGGLGCCEAEVDHPNATNAKQLVVEADTKEKMIAYFNYCLLRWCGTGGRTGVAIGPSDQGARTGIVYMIQLRKETGASGLFDGLLAGSGRTVAVAKRQSTSALWSLTDHILRMSTFVFPNVRGNMGIPPIATVDNDHCQFHKRFLHSTES